MKKIICALLALTVITISLASCGSKKSDKISEEMFDIGVAAEEIANDYLNNRINVETAYDRLESNYRKAEKNVFEDSDTFIWDTLLKHDILMLWDVMGDKINGTGTDSDITYRRDEINKKLYD